jgi:hypothetical protein
MPLGKVEPVPAVVSAVLRAHPQDLAVENPQHVERGFSGELMLLVAGH